ADYTKAVFERFNAIDRFFELQPELAGRVNFVQISGRTRPGLAIFDAYWQNCRQAANRLAERWQTSFWKPLIWIETPISAAALAALYRQAAVMLVNPIRDG